MIYYSGKIKRIGNVDEGDTVTDYLPSERERGITIQSAAITLPWNNHKINIIDTPGHADFTFEVIRSLRVLDGAITILDAVAGVEAQTEKVWKQATALNLPKIVYVNKMDRPGAGFSRTVKEVIQKLETRVVLCNLPYFEVSQNQDLVFKGVIDVIHKKLLKWNEVDANGKEITVVDINDETPELLEMLTKSRESMVETLGEFDERIIDSFLEHDEDYLEIPSQLLDEVIRKATVENYLAPVFCGASFKNIGVQPLMDGVTKYLPSPIETTLPEITRSGKNVPSKFVGEKGLVVGNDSNLTLALAFKVMTHATRGPMTFVRVYSGKLVSNSQLLNTRTGKKLNAKKLLILHGDTPEEVKSISAGNIGVIPGYETEFQTGDTLVANAVGKKNFSSNDATYRLLPIDIPPPLFNAAIEPRTAGDEAHMKKCIEILTREDPSLKVHVDEEMGQTILSGMGELHLEIVRDRLVNDMKAKATLRDIVVSYKETFIGKSEKSTEIKNENVELVLSISSIDDAKNFADQEGAMIIEEDNNVILLPPSAASEHVQSTFNDRRWKCENSLEDLQDAITNGCATALQIGGPVLGFPIHSTLITVKHWNAPVEQSAEQNINLVNAARQLVQSLASAESDFGILEPIMKTKVYVDSNDLGEVTHDLTQRCQAVIVEILDQSTENLENASWAKDEVEKVYVPPDYTIKKSSNTIDNIANKKVIVAETPLREMVGYLSKLRAMTQGRATFDMTFIGMRRAVGQRVSSIVSEYKF
ncbi:MEF2 Ribosome-releasing factor 2 [Candida maltosa Xu316]